MCCTCALQRSARFVFGFCAWSASRANAMSALVSPLTAHKAVHLFRDAKIIPPEPPGPNLPHGELSIGEISGEMYSMANGSDPSLAKYLQLQGKLYPHVVIKCAPKLAQVSLVDVKARQKAGAWRELLERLSAVLNTTNLMGQNRIQDVDGDRQQTDMAWYEGALATLLSTTGLSLTLPSKLYQNIPDTLRRPRDGDIVGFSWHKHKSRFATGLRNDSVCIYDLNGTGGNWLPVSLQSEWQRDILCMEYKPLAGNVLAVGCRYGVCVWNIATAPSSLDARQTVGMDSGGNPHMRLNSSNAEGGVEQAGYPGHAPVNCLAWCPVTGKLATGSVNHGSVLIWDTASSQATPLHQVMLGGVILLSWSPCGRFLFAAGRDCSYRVWETETWQDQKWVAGRLVQSACWSPCGRFLAVALSGESTILFYRIGTEAGSDEQATIDFSPYTIKSAKGTTITVGGSIQEIAWDPTGSRVCISFAKSEYIAVLKRVQETSITERAHLTLSPQGFLRGPGEGTSPVLLRFRNNMSNKAVLSAVWPNCGKISFFPAVFSGAPLVN